MKATIHLMAVASLASLLVACESSQSQQRSYPKASTDRPTAVSQQTAKERQAQSDKQQMASAQSGTAQRQATVPIVEEELQVGKREVQEGTARIEKNIVKKPVEKQVQLRDEEVSVERRSADRPVNDPEQAFQERTIEMTETKEVPMVKKEARQTGEVVMRKESDTRTETIRDTVRKTDVDVVRPGEKSGTQGWEAFESDFRNNFQTAYAGTGNSWDDYEPAYRFGYELANDPEYRGMDWDMIQLEARKEWEQEHRGSWNEYKNAIQYGWKRARQGRG